LNAIFAQEGLTVVGLSDLGLSLSPEETGSAFEENAAIKARETAEFLKANGHENYAVLADDSGLCVDALDGAPGVDSAVFLGENATYNERNKKIIELVDGSERARAAKFVCVIVCVLPCGRLLSARGEVAGEIACEPFGEGGFGYDPIFFVPRFGKTMAELSMDEKNAVSHRGQAMRKMLEQIRENISG
jgi:XTP/dITP diphosphohydrolase